MSIPLLVAAVIVFIAFCALIFAAIRCKGDICASLDSPLGKFSLEAKEQSKTPVRERRFKN
jgi:hypothetical protein